MKGILFLCCSLIVVSGCSKSNYEKEVNGVWQEKAITGKFAGISHWIRFKPDKTFEMKLYVFTDVMDTAQIPCPDTRMDYTRGTYDINGTQITLDGRYCDETFGHDQPNCRGRSTYSAAYSITFVGYDMVFDFEKDDYRKVWLVKQ
jgi:hypothetical protein